MNRLFVVIAGSLILCIGSGRRQAGVRMAAPLQQHYTTPARDAHGVECPQERKYSSEASRAVTACPRGPGRETQMTHASILRLRRDLGGLLPEPRWPPGVSVSTLPPRPDPRLVKAVHAVLEAGFWEGGGGAPAYRQWWRSLRTDSEFDPTLVFIAKDADGVVGMAQCWTSAFVKDLAVHPRARRRGIGAALMLAAFHAFRIRGAPHVDLKVREENSGARALYQALGMTVIAREPG